MCLDKLITKEFRTPCGSFTGKDVKIFLKTFSNIIKAIVARGLYAVYTLLVVWRVTVALQDPLYWLLLFCIILIGLEAIHTIIWQKGGELKWVTPSVFFYLVCSVPSIWLLELKLLRDRQQEDSNSTTIADTSSATDSVININLSDEGWTLAMEQILIFVLVFGKWIAPKGELNRDQLSQLLLVNLGAGADIIELLETFNEDEVRVNSQIVYLVMSVWSWSLLQFCIVPTAYKELPDVQEPIDTRGESAQSSVTEIHELEDRRNGNDIKLTNSINGVDAINKKKPGKTMLRSKSEGVAQALRFKTIKSSAMVKGSSVGSLLCEKNSLSENDRESVVEMNGVEDANHDKISLPNEVPSSDKETELVFETNGNGISGIHMNKKDNKISDPYDHAIIVIHDEEDDLKMKDDIEAILSGRKCCTCFCFYTEMWGMILSLLFQDVPFLITRLFIMFHYNVVSHMTVFFTFKNVVIILLLLNRIRVVVLEEHKNWKSHMREVKIVRKRNEEIIREQRRRGKERSKNKTEEEVALTEKSNGKVEQNDDTTDIVENEATKPQSGSKKWMKRPKWRFWRV